jgi:hypothetical protein
VFGQFALCMCSAAPVRFDDVSIHSNLVEGSSPLLSCVVETLPAMLVGTLYREPDTALPADDGGRGLGMIVRAGERYSESRVQCL